MDRHNLLLDLIKYLKYNDIVEGDGIDSFRDHLPEDPDDVIVFKELEGEGTTIGADGVVRRIQCLCRSSADNPEKSRDKVWEIYSKLDSLNGLLDMRDYDDLDNNRWIILEMINNPIKAKVDDNNRTVYSFTMSTVTYLD